MRIVDQEELKFVAPAELFQTLRRCGYVAFRFTQHVNSYFALSGFVRRHEFSQGDALGFPIAPRWG